MEKKCVVDFRNDDVYVMSVSETDIGLWIVTEPRFKLRRAESAASLGATVMTALEASRREIPTPNLRSVSEEKLKFVGFKTLSSFERGTIHFILTLTEKGVSIVPTTRGIRGGYDLHPDEAVDCKPDPEEVGQLLLQMVSERQS